MKSRISGISRFALAVSLLVTGAVATAADPPDKSKRIGILVGGSLDQRGHLESALADALRGQGYVEGKNLVIERRYANGNGSLVPGYAKELEALHLDAVVTTCTPSTRAMKDASAKTPIVMAVVADPVGQGLVAGLNRSGNNITGTSSQFEDILPKMLEYLNAAAPKAQTVAVLANAAIPVHERLWRLLEKSAQALHLRLVRFDVKGGASLPAVFEAVQRERVGAIFPLPDSPLFFNAHKQIVEFAAKQGLPGMYFAREFVEAGGLMSYGENMSESYRRAAHYVEKVVQGTKPSDLPIAQPTTFELVINRRTANALGLQVPNVLLLRADRLIE